jgi:two-component system sensor histidine kinase RegB
VVIHDDGPGFAPQILSRLGEPYISTRLESGKNMGLGVFIAQTLLEDTGASLSYDNKPSGGALVTIAWPFDGEKNLLFTLAP